ncbi:D-alanyl-D-alanine carboxypeptidase/D-alanyl-D-alanine-endopeptidase [Chitinimonas naiadis]
MVKTYGLVVLLALAVNGWAQDALPARLGRVLKAQGIAEQNLGVLVIPVAGGRPKLSRYPGRPMNPASTMKLLTTLASLEQLGPNYRWKTALLSGTAPQGEVLQGPLYLRGGADPALSWDKLALMLRSLRAKGIREIKGDLVLDRSYFTPSRPDLGAPPFDETPGAYYNVIPDALLVHSNLLELALRSTADAVTVTVQPPLAGIMVESELELTDQACEDWEDDWPLPLTSKDEDGTIHVRLQGSFPRQCSGLTELNALDRNLYIERLFKALWQEMGGVWQGQARDGLVPPDAQLLVEHRSDSLADLVKTANKRSDNAMVRMFYLTLGAERMARQGGENTMEAGAAAIQAWLDTHHIDSRGMVLENGAGLSRRERITPAQLAAVLKAGALSDWSPEYAASLPIAALDGTMRKRLHGSAAAGRARIKTGTLNDTAAIAGYVRDADDKPWILVGIINQPDAKRGREVLDALIDWVAGGTTSSTKPRGKVRQATSP